VAVERYVVEMQGGLAESRLQARVSFLELILILSRDVVSDLWNTVLPEFKRVVLIRFSTEIFEGLNVENYLNAQREKHLRTPNLFHDFLVDLLQQKLAPDPLVPVTQDDPVREAFLNWEAVKGAKEAGPLCAKILEWSEKWHLNENWCLDHAVAVLREWLFDNELRFISLPPRSQWEIQFRGWRSALTDIGGAVVSSRILLDDQVYGKGNDPKPFVLKWQSLKFPPIQPADTAWNFLKEPESQFKRRMELYFRIYLAKKELCELERLEKTQAWRTGKLNPIEFDMQLTRRNGALRKFKDALGKYVNGVKQTMNVAKSKPGLASVDEKRKLPQHLEWAVRYQVGGETQNEIASTAGDEAAGGVSTGTISRAVKDVLTLIRLDNRAKQGRRQGSKKKQLKILRELGH
jgi:hypothetical protein